MLAPPAATRGVTLIELMVGLALSILLLMQAVPSATAYLQNSRIRNAAESLMGAINYARAQAIARNSLIRFSLVDNLSDSCVRSSTGNNWIVNGLASDPNPDHGCNSAPVTDFNTAPPGDPLILLTGGGAGEGWSSAAPVATDRLDAPASVIDFNGLGQQLAGGIKRIRVTHSTGNCRDDPQPGSMRCLDVFVATSGEAKLCDRMITDATDSRFCPANNL